MHLTIVFFSEMLVIVVAIWPLYVGLALIIAALSMLIGRGEGWPMGDSLYFGFVTATTVGYGDFRPSLPRNKLLAIVIAVFGFMLTGILVAAAVHAGGVVHDEIIS